MRTQSPVTLMFLCILIFSSIQFSSCKKEDTDLTKTNSSASTDNSDAISLNASLVARYTFNGDVLDHSGNNNNVNFNSATATAGKKGIANTAYYFDGSTSYMTVPNSTSLNPVQGITLAALVRPTGFYQGSCHGNRILMKGTSDQDNGIYFLGFDDMPYYNYQGCDEVVQAQFENFYGAYGDNQFNSAGVTATDYIKSKRWYTVVFSYDGTTAKLYINGTLAGTQTKVASFNANLSDLWIGRTPNGSYPYWFTGVIDELRIYKKSVTGLQAQKIYQSLQQ